MTTFLQQKYPPTDSERRRILLSFVMSGFVFLFLFVFRPFGLSTESEIVQIAAGFGASCLVVMLLLNVLVIRLLPRFFDENNWVVWKEMLWEFLNVALVGLANAVFASWMFGRPFDGQLILVFEGFTIAVAFLPLSFFTLFNYVVKRQQYERVSAQLTPMLKAVGRVPKSAGGLFVIERAGEDSMALSTDDLLYLQAADNYLDVYYLRDHVVHREVIRKTLKSAAEELETTDNMLQVHRSFIVNLNHVVRISGNAQGLKLHFEQTDAVVPVSRKLTDTLQTYFAVRPQASR